MTQWKEKRVPRGLRGLWHVAGALLIFLCLAMILGRVLAPNAWRRGVASFAEFAVGGRGDSCAIATGGEEGAYFEWGTQLRARLLEQGAYDLTVLESRGSLENLDLVRSGEADLGLIQGGLQEDMSDLAAVASLSRQYVHLVVREDSTIHRLGDLAGKRVWLGPEKSGFAALGKLVLKFLSLDPPAEVVHGELDSLAPQLSQGVVDAAFLVYGFHAPFLDELLRAEGYRLAAVPEAEAIAQHIPGTYAAEIPPCTYGNNRTLPSPETGPVRTLSVDTLLIARPDTPQGAVKEVLRAIYDVKFQKVAGLAGLTEARGRQIVDLPLHSAAEAYYRRNAPITSDMFEIASFFLAAVVCTASTVHFLMGRHRQRRTERLRARITPYFEALLDLSETAASATDEKVLADVLQTMMATQRKAEKEWLDGTLDTEHMENLYLVYSIRSSNTYRALLEKHLVALREQNGGRRSNEETARPGGKDPAQEQGSSEKGE